MLWQKQWQKAEHHLFSHTTIMHLVLIVDCVSATTEILRSGTSADGSGC